VGGREDSNVYIGQKLKNADAVGINARHVKLPQTATQPEVKSLFLEFWKSDSCMLIISLILPVQAINNIATIATV
jgi:methylenetetrahydrofolate dehydrogenase (NADP+)/methenyltetrahydrofolate cyclohydrolase/formyltetrahydrofolate synthetase